MTHHISKEKDVIVRKWIDQVRNDRVTYPHGTPFEKELSIIEELLNHEDEKEEPPRSSFVGGKDSFKNRK